MQKKDDLYRISRIINNNVITSIDGTESEIVLMGKGISFNKKIGEFVNKKVVEKTFILNGKEKSRYIDIINDIPTDCLNVAIEIIDYAGKRLELKANPIAYITLADHINFTIERAKKNIFIKNEMLNEIKNFYFKEFEIGKQSILEINKKFGIKLPIDEAGFIAFHIINLYGEFPNSSNIQRLNIINKVVELIESYFNIELDKDSIYYERFLTHLKYFSIRAFSKDKDTDYKDDFVYRMMKVQYPEIEKCVLLVQEYLDYNFQINVTNEEKGYLIIHIKNLLNNNKIVT